MFTKFHVTSLPEMVLYEIYLVSLSEVHKSTNDYLKRRITIGAHSIIHLQSVLLHQNLNPHSLSRPVLDFQLMGNGLIARS